MPMYFSLFTVTIPVSYTSEHPVALEATVYLCRQSIKIIRLVDMTSENIYRIFSNLICTLFTVSEGLKIRCGLELRAD